MVSIQRSAKAQGVHSVGVVRSSRLWAAPSEKSQCTGQKVTIYEPAVCNWPMACAAVKEPFSSWSRALGFEGSENRDHQLRWMLAIIVCIRTIVMRGVIVAGNVA